MFEYKTTSRSADNLHRAAAAGWRLHSITEHQQIWEREVVEEKPWIDRYNAAMAAHSIRRRDGISSKPMASYGEQWIKENPKPAPAAENPFARPDPIKFEGPGKHAEARSVPGETPTNPSADAVVQAQIEGAPIPAPEPEIPEVVASWVGSALENALINAIRRYVSLGCDATPYIELPAEVRADLQSLALALENDTYLLMTCDQACTTEPLANVNAHIETVNPDVVTTVSKPWDGRSATLENEQHTGVKRAEVVDKAGFADRKLEFGTPPAGHAPQWAAGWQIIGSDGNEFYVKGSYAHCTQELVEALNAVTGPNTASAQQVVLNLKKRPTMKTVAYDGDVLAWIKPV